MGGTLYRVKKTSIYLEADLDVALAREAAEQGITKAEFIRASLRRAVGTAPPRIAAIGVGRGPGDVSENVEGHLAETGFGE